MTTPIQGTVCSLNAKPPSGEPLYKIWNVSRDVTTPFSGTVCSPSAGTSYDQPAHQIGSLYVYSPVSYTHLTLPTILRV